MRNFFCIVLFISAFNNLIAQSSSPTCYIEGEDTVTDIDGNVYKTVKKVSNGGLRKTYVPLDIVTVK